ncbi:MAG TPA: YheC/YheD family protein [Firmicutes bacterium]|nr:YheC/YheD family protein [Bacillota bacterium]
MRCRIYGTSAGGSDTVSMTRAAARRLGLYGRKTVTVKVGSRSVRAGLKILLKGSSTTIVMNRTLISALGLPKMINLRATGQGGVLRIGPIVGILMPGARGGVSPFGNMTLGTNYFIQEGRRASVLPIAFTVKGINFKRGVLKGYTLVMGANPYWVRRVLPIPDVVFDQVTVRRKDRSAEVREVRRKLAERGIPYFNPGFFDKWDLHNRLMQCEELQPHLPETYLLTVENLRLAAEKYNRLFIKPVEGSLGRHINVLLKNKEHGWTLRRASRWSRRELITDLAAVPGKLPKIEPGTYLVQQGLDLCRCRGRPIDIRVLAQRNLTGKWRVTKFFARVPPRGQLIANITRGAKGMPVPWTLAHCFRHGKVVVIRRQLVSLALKVCRYLEKTIDGHLGELGVDLGVDTKGHVWIIEVNAKPHRKAYEDIEERPGARRSYRRPMLFAAYLAGFHKSQGGAAKAQSGKEVKDDDDAPQSDS